MKHPGLLSDILFKIVFGTESSEPTLCALLNALLDLNGPQRIVDLELVSPISEKEYIDGPEEVLLPDNLAQEEGITMALESMRRAYAKDTVRELIEAREKADRDEVSRLKYATEQGVAQGIAQGVTQGVSLVARRMLEQGLDTTMIEQATGLPAHEIARLRDEAD